MASVNIWRDRHFWNCCRRSTRLRSLENSLTSHKVHTSGGKKKKKNEFIYRLRSTRCGMGVLVRLTRWEHQERGWAWRMNRGRWAARSRSNSRWTRERRWSVESAEMLAEIPEKTNFDDSETQHRFHRWSFGEFIDPNEVGRMISEFGGSGGCEKLFLVTRPNPSGSISRRNHSTLN